MKVKAKLKNLRISPRKVRVSTDMVRGCMLDEAVSILEGFNKKANEPLKKLLLSAKANAVNNFDMDESFLRISEIMVGEGPTLKRWRPRAYGRASQILKRTSHIYITLEEVKRSERKSGKADKKKKEEIVDKKTVVETEGSEKIVKKLKKDDQKISKNKEKKHRSINVKRKELSDK